ncbi:formate dehydrogenase H [Clostridium coskatii]|uniref:Formate dehydrogenase H n=2 Tax=Clostridium coskatii TaxID=1705578 RepID=A0A166S261_9CLOT|nr:Formate dehydrogenase H [Clostridium coskatii]OBR90945.1 formate dehydrogenase H [Clostridium coskatii]
MSNGIHEIDDTDLLLIFGYNGAASHPIVAKRIVRAKQKGAKVIVVDPRITESGRIADLWLPIKNGTNMVLVNTFANILINKQFYNKQYVEDHTVGFEEYRSIVENYTPEYAEKVTGIPSEDIVEAMKMYSGAKNAMILYGMGVCQFAQAVDVVKGLASIALLTGNFGRPNVGIGPVRGQNNVQGACDMGALPNVYPGYQSVTDDAIREKFEKAWGVKLPNKIGYHLTQVPELTLKEDKIKAYYIMGEDPVQSDPDSNEMRETLDKMELVIVQDIFMNKTALHADVILPSTSWGEHEGVFSSADRGFQRFRKAVEPKGDVKPDWEIISEIACAMGYNMHYNNTEEIWNELINLCPNFKGATYKRLEELGGIQWPCPSENHPGTSYLYKGNKFNTPTGKANLFAAEWRPPVEQTDKDYPLVLSTVREVGHYSVRTMTGNCRALQQLADEPGYVQINPMDAKAEGIIDGELMRISSRRGSVVARALVTERANKGAVYMTYQWWVGACNELTSNNLDPVSKTPELKYCAVKIEAIKDQKEAEKFIKDQYDLLKKKMNV